MHREGTFKESSILGWVNFAIGRLFVPVVSG